MSHTPELWKKQAAIVLDSGRLRQALERSSVHLSEAEQEAVLQTVSQAVSVNGCAGLNPAGYRACVEAGEAVLKDLRGWIGCVARSHGHNAEVTRLTESRLHALKQALALADGKGA